ncbi:MAG: type II toxin-antitoxin system prevent-host-death family antitoxin [Verrucomicrobiae bacterium]|nr:type II toxin-antitoxin system prevent-host-death family antitoxin [Verrucomicrobiae bacterium]
MKKIINIQEAKTHLSRLVEEAVAGEEIVVGKAGKPMVRLVPYREPRAPRAGGQFGGGRIMESEDCWQPDEDPFDGAVDMPLLYRSVDQPSSRVAEDSGG